MNGNNNKHFYWNWNVVVFGTLVFEHSQIDSPLKYRIPIEVINGLPTENQFINVMHIMKNESQCTKPNAQKRETHTYTKEVKNIFSCRRF